MWDSQKNKKLMKTLTLTTLFLFFSSLYCFAKSGREIIAENGFKPEVKPMITTEWSQDGGENALLPMIGDDRALTGCGVTATAQVMKYWSAPEYGIGENYYIWNNPAGGRDVLYANFGSTHYDWSNMIDRYKGNPSASTIEINAVATLMRDLGIALQVKYEDGSTATNIEYISSVLKRYYGYNPNMTIHRYINGAYTMDEWLTIIYSELSAGRPIIMGGHYEGANHIYVADGYDNDGNVHLNLGKANIGGHINTNGYFDITTTGETYTSDMRMLIGIAPYPVEAETQEFTVNEAGTLKGALGGAYKSRKVCRIKILGNLNEKDFEWLKELSSFTRGQLSYIDMSEVSAEGDAIPEEAFTDSYTLQEIILPASVTKIAPRAFRNANGLWRVTLPETLKEIGDYAFSGCRYLESLSFPASLQKIGSNPMRYNHLSVMSVAEDNESFTISNNALCNINKNAIYAMPMQWTEEYSVEEGIRTIRNHAFSMQCMIPAIRLPSSVKDVFKWAFYECIGLKDFYVSATVPPELGEDSFSRETLLNCVLHIPVGRMLAYLSSDWSEFVNIVEDESLSVISTEISSENDQIGIYDLTGIRVTSPKRGTLYIIRHSNGSVEKKIY